MRKALFIIIPLLTAACGGDGGTGPGGTNLTGTFIGPYTATPEPGVVYEGVFQITQVGSSVSGTLTTNGGRAGTVAGSVSGTRITASITFTGACAGTATTTADIVNNGGRLVGNYNANDCVGQYSGGYNISRQ